MRSPVHGNLRLPYLHASPKVLADRGLGLTAGYRPVAALGTACIGMAVGGEAAS